MTGFFLRIFYSGKQMDLRVIFFLIVVSSCQAGLARQASPRLQSPATAKSDLNVESFEMVWQTIRDSHWDQELVGASWEQHRRELLPRIKAVKSVTDARTVMNELCERLGQSHFGIIPADSYDLVDGIPGGQSNIGITVRLVEQQLVVTAVRPGSSAAASGVQPGWSIVSIRDQTAENLIEKFAKVAQGPQRMETIVALAMDRLTSGKAGKLLPIVFLNDDHQHRELKIEFDEPPGRFAKFGHLPPIRVNAETRTLAGNIGYFRFNVFLDPFRIMPAYRNFVRDSNHSNGLIIDLRGNMGGLAGMTMGMSSEFVDQPRKLGTMTMKGNTLNFVVNPHPEPVTAPIAVLVDESSISSAEIFAGGLQDLGLARIFGRRTAGLALPSVIIKLPNGDGFQYAIANYHSASGESLEKLGVVPDEEIKLTRENLQSEGDPILNAAIRWIKGKNQD